MRRFTKYFRRILENGELESLPFTREHYALMGLAPSVLAGMPVLEAYQLMNYWNANQHVQRYVYWVS